MSVNRQSISTSIITSILFPDIDPITDSKTLKYKTGIAWYILPRSRFEGIRRLLPSQILTIHNASLQPRALIAPIHPSLNYREKLQK